MGGGVREGVREEWRDKTGEKVFQEEHPNFCHAPVNVLTASVWSTGGSVIQPNRARQRGAARSRTEQDGAARSRTQQDTLNWHHLTLHTHMSTVQRRHTATVRPAPPLVFMVNAENNSSGRSAPSDL